MHKEENDPTGSYHPEDNQVQSDDPTEGAIPKLEVED